ncbi:MAG: SDR family oxidoreductase [Planctomycetota bacterium]
MSDSNAPVSVAGKVALVTGGNRGIGKSIVDALVASGASKVYVGARNPDSATDVVKQHGNKVEVLRIDLQDPASITAAAQHAGDVDIVVNNGGVLKVADALNPDAYDTLDFEIDVNVKGLMRVAQAFAPVLKSNGGGALVQLNSVASIKNFAAFATYSASKAASYSITQGLRESLREQNTLVVSVHPGPIATDMASDAGMPDEITDPPEVVADAIVDALKTGTFHVFPDRMARDFWAAYQGFAEALVEPSMAEA